MNEIECFITYLKCIYDSAWLDNVQLYVECNIWQVTPDFSIICKHISGVVPQSICVFVVSIVEWLGVLFSFSDSPTKNKPGVSSRMILVAHLHPHLV